MRVKYDWPPIDGLLAFSRKHGLNEAARRLGIQPNSLRCYFNRNGLRSEDYSPVKSLNADALKEIHELLD